MTDLTQYQPSAERLTKRALYDFSIDGHGWTPRVFDVAHGEGYMDRGGSVWLYVRKCQTPLGEIKSKPVELVDGEYYLFNRADIEFVGQYYQGYLDGYHNVSECTNIRRLKVAD